MTARCRYKPGYDPKTRQYIGKKPQTSRLKVKPTKTCPICAETFKAARTDQTFCGTRCRMRNHRGVVPEAIKEQANVLIEKRQLARERAADKRRKDRDLQNQRLEEKRTSRYPQRYLL